MDPSGIISSSMLFKVLILSIFNICRLTGIGGVHTVTTGPYVHSLHWKGVFVKCFNTFEPTIMDPIGIISSYVLLKVLIFMFFNTYRFCCTPSTNVVVTRLLVYSQHREVTSERCFNAFEVDIMDPFGIISTYVILKVLKVNKCQFSRFLMFGGSVIIYLVQMQLLRATCFRKCLFLRIVDSLQS